MNVAPAMHVLITGSSRGIGRATALRFGRDRATVSINYTRDAKAADAVVDAITAAGGQAAAFQADLNDPASVQRLFAAAIAANGPLDAVVSSAATSIFKPHTDLSLAEFDTMFQLNTRGAFLVLQEAARRVVDGGAIVQLSTGGVRQPSFAGGAYAGSKAAIEVMAMALAKELGSRRVRVNAVSPGPTRTDGLVAPEPLVRRLVDQTPLGRLGEPEDIAAVIHFLCSPAAAWMTGQTLQVNGGLL
jgi:3-oxoacyl-[acyl-carrier protein] reductase